MLKLEAIIIYISKSLSNYVFWEGGLIMNKKNFKKIIE